MKERLRRLLEALGSRPLSVGLMASLVLYLMLLLGFALKSPPPVVARIAAGLPFQLAYALLAINTRNGRREIDARSSDAIALALRADVPIYAAEAVLEQGGQAMDEEEETEEEETPLLPAPRRSERTETERRPTPTAREESEERDVNEKSLSVFRDFINSLEKPKPPDEIEDAFRSFFADLGARLFGDGTP